MTPENLLAAVAAKKAELDALRVRIPGGTTNFDHSQDLELTYTSNAIEGNTLTAVETTMVIEQGITVGGKPLKDHLEAIDQFEAIGYVRALARQRAPLTEMDVRSLHRLVMLRSNPAVAGRYADQGSLRADRYGALQLSATRRNTPPDGRFHPMARHCGRQA